jgi:uncharacterized protein (TIGR02145 family)
MKNLKFLFLFCLFFSQQTAVHAQLFGGLIKSQAPRAVASLTCGAATVSPSSFNANVSYTGTATVPYTGGNGAAYGAGTGIGSTGVTGLTAALQAGTLTTGAGNLIYNITGTPSANGVASFAISFAGFNCTLTLSSCGAFVATNVFKEFLCHNLGADTSLDPHIPVVGLQGAYIQWGKKGPLPATNEDVRVTWLTAANDASLGFASAPTVGSTTPSGTWASAETNDDAWNVDENSPVKVTANDPCPTGYRVPTRNEWVAVATYNTPSRTGLPWSAGPTEFGNALHYGTDAGTKLLTLPAAGNRSFTNGALFNRGSTGNYWSSTDLDSIAYALLFNSSVVNPASTKFRTDGFSVRCIAE